MKKFNYSHAYPINVIDGELVTIVSPWNSLQSLLLKTSPLPPNFTTSLTLAILPMLSKQAHMLSKLELYIDEYESVDYVFRSLTCFDITGSSILNAQYLALYLSCILPTQYSLMFTNGDDSENEFAARGNEVDVLLPYFIQAYESNHYALRIMIAEKDKLVLIFTANS
ncbi:hypothetical protein EW145_g7506 [Phellinidium pouzarii]|uniref:Uncharacterized protein n=1 Tax=Phellinidium pouzarii TaxID=167371 RepID=A0A4S4KJ24_9AGAM|nr:hypothetical protein EW145_g7506 [Phellinidium pouzarii]